MTTYTITTAKGSKVDVVVSETGAVRVDVNGKPHSATTELVNHPQQGWALKLAGNAFAPVPASDFGAVKALFDAAAKLNAEWLAEEGRKYAASPAAFHDTMRARMYGRNSRH